MSNEMLIRCCAPTMASLKTGNMFNCPFAGKEEMIAELRRLNRILGPKGLRVLPCNPWDKPAPVPPPEDRRLYAN